MQQFALEDVEGPGMVGASGLRSVSVRQGGLDQHVKKVNEQLPAGEELTHFDLCPVQLSVTPHAKTEDIALLQGSAIVLMTGVGSIVRLVSVQVTRFINKSLNGNKQSHICRLLCSQIFLVPTCKDYS